jgi:hypothetical protein
MVSAAFDEYLIRVSFLENEGPAPLCLSERFRFDTTPSLQLKFLDSGLLIVAYPVYTLACEHKVGVSHHGRHP